MSSDLPRIPRALSACGIGLAALQFFRRNDPSVTQIANLYWVAVQHGPNWAIPCQFAGNFMPSACAVRRSAGDSVGWRGALPAHKDIEFGIFHDHASGLVG